MILKFLIVLVLAVFSNAAPAAVKDVSEDQELQTDHDILSSIDAELGEHFEGDLLLTPTQWEAIQQASTSRNGLINMNTRWPNRTVVYRIVEKNYAEWQIKMIKEGMADIANKSCIRFRPQNNEDKDVVVIQGTERGCYSNVGRTGGTQVLNLEINCFEHGTVVHEMLHTLGFYHMQSTYDRDNFVQIVWRNIRSGAQINFQKYDNNTVTDFGIPYDYESLLHYPATAFSKNGKATIIPLQEGVELGQRKGLSERDVMKLNRMYCED